jgi:hypothetical protein
MRQGSTQMSAIGQRQISLANNPTRLPPPQRGPRDAGVAGCPSGRDGEGAVKEAFERRAGMIAGCSMRSDYWCIHIDGRGYRAH